MQINWQTGAASAVMQTLYWSVVVKRELSQKAKDSVQRSIFGDAWLSCSRTLSVLDLVVNHLYLHVAFYCRGFTVMSLPSPMNL